MATLRCDDCGRRKRIGTVEDGAIEAASLAGWMRIQPDGGGNLRGLCPMCWFEAIPEIRREQARMLERAVPMPVEVDGRAGKTAAG